MSGKSFRPNNTIKHRYEKEDVLQKCLRDFDFKEKDWEIRANNGFDIKLPRKLTEEEVNIIYEAYEKAEKERKDKANSEIER
ncbi:hypothetical protein AB5N19_03713 [Seiridium cardinale]